MAHDLGHYIVTFSRHVRPLVCTNIACLSPLERNSSVEYDPCAIECPLFFQNDQIKNILSVLL